MLGNDTRLLDVALYLGVPSPASVSSRDSAPLDKFQQAFRKAISFSFFFF